MRTHSSRVFLLGSLLFLISLCAVLYGQVAPHPLITRPVDETQLVALRGNTHPLAQPQFDMGTAPPDLPLNRMLLVLKRSPEQEHGLRTLLDSQQDKNSPSYHKWMTPDEFGQQFGASDQDLQVVTTWLQSQGFHIDQVSHGRSVIEFSGVESQVEGAFRTQIHKYTLPSGEQHWANATDPQIPAALAPAVAGVWSLHDFRKQPKIRILPDVLKTKYTPGRLPDTTLTGSRGTIHALSPADYATIYNINPVYASGNYGGAPVSNASIAVVGRSDLFNGGEDVLNFDQVFNPSFCCYSVNTVLNGPDPGDLGGAEEAEATLDVTWSGSIAPYSKIYHMQFVVSASTNTTDGVDLSELFIIDNNVASIMTESFSSCEGYASSAEAQGIANLAEQAAAEGITYIVSSGDSGAAAATIRT
ncbi:MAG TPA: protease pro-enzyme activation domain-containing protein [Terriglobales bacterium]